VSQASASSPRGTRRSFEPCRKCARRHVEAHLGELQANEFRDAQPARVEHFQHRTIAQPKRVPGPAARAALRHRLRERLWKARRLLRGSSLSVGSISTRARAREPVEALQARVQPRLGARADAVLLPGTPRVTPGEILGEIGSVHSAAWRALPSCQSANNLRSRGRIRACFSLDRLEPDGIAEFVKSARCPRSSLSASGALMREQPALHRQWNRLRGGRSRRAAGGEHAMTRHTSGTGLAPQA